MTQLVAHLFGAGGFHVFHGLREGLDPLRAAGQDVGEVGPHLKVRGLHHRAGGAGHLQLWRTAGEEGGWKAGGLHLFYLRLAQLR